MEGGCSFTSRPVVICMDEQIGHYRICFGMNKEKFSRCMENKDLETILYHGNITTFLPEDVAQSVHE